MTYIIIAIVLYLIYRMQKPRILMSKAEIVEKIQEDIQQREVDLLGHLQKSHLRDYMQTDKTLLDCGRKNFIRLRERFKHDDIKFAQIVKDWIDYLNALDEAVYESELLDVSTSETSNEHYEKRDEFYVKIQEIEKRFKELLGNEYIDPEKILNPQQKGDTA